MSQMQRSVMARLALASGAAMVGLGATNVAAQFQTGVACTVDTVAQLKTLDSTQFTRAQLIGYHAAGDGVQSVYRCDLNDKATADDGCQTIVAADGARWKLVHNGTITSRQAGAQAGADATAILKALAAAGVAEIVIDANHLVADTVTLSGGQRVTFKGGSITATAAPANGILYAGAASPNVVITRPQITTSAGVLPIGINLTDSTGSEVDGGALLGCTMALEATTTNYIGYKVARTFINPGNPAASCLYVSGVNGADLSGVRMTGGKEGIGIYNGAQAIGQSLCDSYDQAQDGFVVIKGAQISYGECFAWGNGQSGFTTHRQGSGGDTQGVSWTACHAENNAADGFDIRGSDGAPYNVNTFFNAVGCTSRNNGRTGVYVVNAEGTTLTGFVTSGNALQGIFVDTSARTKLNGCRSESNATGVASGANCAGILIYNSNEVTLTGCDSTNSAGATQDFGVSFTGTSSNCSIVGGDYQNNRTAWANLINGNGATAAWVAAAAFQTSASVWTCSIAAQTGVYVESGFGVPTHVRPAGSLYLRTDGGSGGEMYVSNGAGNWTLK